MSENPFQSPSISSQSQPISTHIAADRFVRIAISLLLTISSLWILLLLVLIAGICILPGGLTRYEIIPLTSLGLLLLAAVVHWFTVVRCLIRQEDVRVRRCAYLNFIPFVSPFLLLGIPLAIWLLLRLRTSRVVANGQYDI